MKIIQKVTLYKLAIVCICLTAGISKSQNPSTMYVKGRFLYSAQHEKVVLRGVNEMFIWSGDKTGEKTLPEIAKTGANSVRLVWNSEGKPEDLDQLIGNCLKNKMIPIVELHDATGDWNKLPQVLDYWIRPELQKIVIKHQKWLLINIANEVGGGDTKDSLFVSQYQSAITKLRNVGYKTPLIIDASDWGKDELMIQRNWKALLSHDPLKNIIFSVHTYWVDVKAEARLDAFLHKVVSDTIPFMFGEGPQPYGWDCKTPFPYLNCMEKAQKHDIGWLTWSWGAVKNGDCATKGAFDMTSDGLYGHWNSNWARLIATDDKNSIQKTSKRPKSLK